MKTPDFGSTDAMLLGQLVHRLNPAWDSSGIWAALGNHRHDGVPFADLAVAAVTAAANPANHEPGPRNTPERIWFAGPHWPTKAKTLLPRGPRCPDHDTFDAATCPCCHSDVHTGIRTPDQIGTHHEPAGPEAVACEDHPTNQAGTCPTCWEQVQAGTRRKARIGRTLHPSATPNINP